MVKAGWSPALGGARRCYQEGDKGFPGSKSIPACSTQGSQGSGGRKEMFPCCPCQVGRCSCSPRGGSASPSLPGLCSLRVFAAGSPHWAAPGASLGPLPPAHPRKTGIQSQTFPASPKAQRNHQHNNSAAAEACPALTPPAFLKYLFFIGAAYLSPLRDAFVTRFISLDPPSCSPRSIPSAATCIIIFLPLQKCHQKSCRNPGLCQGRLELCVPPHRPTPPCHRNS